jgi:thioesterase domain-containing protein
VFTLFDFFGLVLPIAGVVVGAMRGFERGGVMGAIMGAALGVVIGVIAARLILIVPVALLSRSLKRRSTAELRTELRGKASLVPNVLLMELRRRGEASDEDLAAIFDLLVDESMEQRSRGLAALRSAYPELAAKIPEYRFEPLDDAGRAAVSRLRQERTVAQ